ncbi:MAG: proline dehydrogenase family protein [Candidatus Methanoperedens sp.]
MSFLSRFARQWIAGETLDSAIKYAGKANNAGMGVIINFLGEHVRNAEEAKANLEENMRILESIEISGVNAALSIKLTQLGLDIDKKMCRSNVETIVDSASSRDIFVWIDMENSPYTRDTIDIYMDVLRKYAKVGIAIQANLKRSEKDVKTIAASGGIIRLVKGAYTEKKDIAFMSRSEIAINFSKLMGYLFYKSPFFAIATHDDLLIDEAKKVNEAHGKRIEFQMLMGVRERLKNRLVSEGVVVVDYIPYGKKWFPYTQRRISERKRNILLVVRSVFDF